MSITRVITRVTPKGDNGATDTRVPDIFIIVVESVIVDLTIVTQQTLCLFFID
jgi:hypothetical protein